MKTMNFVKLVGKAINVLPRDGYIFFHAEIDREYVPCLWKSKHKVTINEGQDITLTGRLTHFDVGGQSKLGVMVHKMGEGK